MRAFLCVEIGEPAQRSEAGHKAIFTATRDDKVRDALKTPANRSAWDRKTTRLLTRPHDRVLIISRPEENSIVNPLGLDELKLPADVRSDKREHQTSVSAVIIHDAFGQRRAISSSAPDHSV